MVVDIDLVLLLLAALCFLIQVSQPWTGFGTKVHWVALGLFFWVCAGLTP